MSDNDEVIKLRPNNTYNYASLGHMGYIFIDGLWRHMSEVDEEECGSEGGGQSIDREQHRHATQSDQ